MKQREDVDKNYCQDGKNTTFHFLILVCNTYHAYYAYYAYHNFHCCCHTYNVHNHCNHQNRYNNNHFDYDHHHS